MRYGNEGRHIGLRGQYVPMNDEEQNAIFGSTLHEVCFSYSESVNLAMGEEQARRLGRGTQTCVLPDLPDEEDVYYRLFSLPKDKVTFGGDSWDRQVYVPREHIAEIMDILYPDGLNEHYWDIISAIEGDTIRIQGFGD